jgi:hypothetical protein
VQEFAATQHLEQFIVHDDVLGPCLWRYQCPQRRLLSREQIDVSAIPRSTHLLHPQHGPFRLICAAPEERGVHMTWKVVHGVEGDAWLSSRDGGAFQLWADQDWLVVAQAAAAGWRVRWLSLRGGGLAASVDWPGDAPPVARPVRNGWLLHDGEGRVLHLDVERSVTAGFAVR